MFTQCPECGVAFRVTADILKQAAARLGISYKTLLQKIRDCSVELRG